MISIKEFMKILNYKINLKGIFYTFPFKFLEKAMQSFHL